MTNQSSVSFDSSITRSGRSPYRIQPENMKEGNNVTKECFLSDLTIANSVAVIMPTLRHPPTEVTDCLPPSLCLDRRLKDWVLGLNHDVSIISFQAVRVWCWWTVSNRSHSQLGLPSKLVSLGLRLFEPTNTGT